MSRSVPSEPRPKLHWAHFRAQARWRRRRERSRRRPLESGRLRSLSLWLESCWCLIV